MGCDIHLYVEVKKDGKWVSQENWVPEDEEEGEDPRAPDVSYRERYYHERNYDLFSILANVRNGYGFAGCPTGEGFRPITEPKGLPDDVSPQVKACSDQWGCDGHSHSHLTVAELMAFDWTQTTTKYGVVSAWQFWEWTRWRRADGEGPEAYCGDVSGGRVRKISEDEMTKLTDALAKDVLKMPYEDKRKIFDAQLGSTYTSVSWGTPYYRAAGEFMSETLPKLWRLGAYEDVRIVFWFDN